MATLAVTKAQPNADVVVLGDTNVDVIARFPLFPVQRRDALAEGCELHCGGSAANTAMALARLGVRVHLISRVGRDALAAEALRSLRQAGVLLGGVQRDPMVMTGLIYVVVTPDGERTMLSYRGANACTDPEEIDEEQICRVRHLHLSGYALLAEPQRSAALRAWGKAQECGVSLSLDPGLAPAQQGVVEEILPAIDLLLPTLAEAQALTGEVPAEACAHALLQRGAQSVVIKLGRDGCLVAEGDLLLRAAAFQIEARDSTGAGDGFDAGVIAGRLGGLSWGGAAALGNALGALATAQVGADMATLSARSIIDFLERQPGPTLGAQAMAMAEAVAFLRTLSPRADVAQGLRPAPRRTHQ
jgi:ribokinase